MDRRLFAASVAASTILSLHFALAQLRAAWQDDGGSLTNIPGLCVGHLTDSCRPTGCMVVVPEDGAVGGVDVRSSAPGTRETDLLQPANLVIKVHAVLLSGGSTFGLDAATDVMH